MPVQPLGKDFLIWVDVVQDVVRVLLLTSCEHDNLVQIGQLFQAVYQARAETYLDFIFLESELERWLESLGDAAFELGSHEGLVHVEDEQFVFGLPADLDSLHHHLVLVGVLLAHFLHLVAVLEQLDQLEVDQLGRVVHLVLHDAGCLVLNVLEHVVTAVRILVVEVLAVDLLQLVFVLGGVFFLFVDFLVDLLKSVFHRHANVAHTLRLLDH